MALRISCPSCRRALRVPDHLAGRTARCPSCQAAFVAVAREEAPPPPPPAYEPLPPSRPRDAFSEPDDRRDDEWEDERRQRRRRRRKLDAARTKCLVPGILLIVIALINIVIMGMAAISGILELGDVPRDEGTVPAIIISLASILASAVILVGAIQMVRLQTWPLAATAAGLSIVPCVSPCVVIGIPFGIWGLIVLCDADVKRSFD